METHRMRLAYRDEIMRSTDVPQQISRPGPAALEQAKALLTSGSITAADGTISGVPLLGGAKIQIGVVIVSNRGHVVDAVTRIFETDLSVRSSSGTEFFANVKKARGYSNLLARALMLYGERKLLIDEEADWRIVHGELLPHELRVGAGRPGRNLPAIFELARRFVDSMYFLAVSESPEGDLDIMNAAIVLEPGEYIELRSLRDDLTLFLNGDPELGISQANFDAKSRGQFEKFVDLVGDSVKVVLVKAGQRPFLVQCHADLVPEAVALFLADALWTRGFEPDARSVVRGFPFHLDLADQIARNLFRGADFRNFVESRLMTIDVEQGLFDLDPRRTRA
ncbi:MAG TPA: hypothetical protein VFM96_00430 [Gaiellaceae bacterium]|nr:hypothetical protein [Gaiellaceae bacterium]